MDWKQIVLRDNPGYEFNTHSRVGWFLGKEDYLFEWSDPVQHFDGLTVGSEFELNMGVYLPVTRKADAGRPDWVTCRITKPGEGWFWCRSFFFEFDRPWRKRPTTEEYFLQWSNLLDPELVRRINAPAEVG